MEVYGCEVVSGYKTTKTHKNINPLSSVFVTAMELPQKKFLFYCQPSVFKAIQLLGNVKYLEHSTLLAWMID